MSTKVDQTSAVGPHVINMSAKTTSSTASTMGPKVSRFAAKTGFVIPKNKLSGSLVPIFRGGKKLGGNDTANEVSMEQIQRKTKWGPDLTQDASVRRGRALAYQVLGLFFASAYQSHFVFLILIIFLKISFQLLPPFTIELLSVKC